MGVLVGKHKDTYPAWRRVEKAEQPEKRQESYMNQLTRSFLTNFRAFIEAANQS